MTPDTSNVERVVRQVLAEMGIAPDMAAGAAASPSTPAGELILQARVVTLADVQAHLEGTRRMVVRRSAVITPSVRDELRRRNIALVVQPADGASSASTPARLVFVATGKRFDPSPLAAALGRDGVEAELRRSDCLIRATDELAADLADQRTLGLLATTYPAVALCLANRQAGVRAVQPDGPASLADDVASVGANLLVVNPERSGPFALRKMAVDFCRLGPSECPDVFRERLS